MSSDEHPAVRLQINNLGQQLAYIHRCRKPGQPVCDRCRREAHATWQRLSRSPEPA